MGKPREHVLSVSAFRCGTEREAALKPLEEAAEVFGAWQRWVESGDTFRDVREYKRLGEELADCVTACVNLADRAGVRLDRELACVEEKNRRRGRYHDGR